MSNIKRIPSCFLLVLFVVQLTFCNSLRKPNMHLVDSQQHDEQKQHLRLEQTIEAHRLGSRLSHLKTRFGLQSHKQTKNSQTLQNYGGSFVIWGEIIIPVAIGVFLIVLIGYTALQCRQKAIESNNSSIDHSQLAASRLIDEEGQGEETKRTNVINERNVVKKV